MEIKLTAEESKEYFYNALCNGMGMVNYYDLEWVIDNEQYGSASAQLRKNNAPSICHEDVIMQMLEMGYTISLKDLNESGYDATICIDDVINRVQLTPIDILMDMVNQEDDANTADAIIQSVFYQDVIFG